MALWLLCSTLDSWIGEFVFWCHEQVNSQFSKSRCKRILEKFHSIFLVWSEIVFQLYLYKYYTETSATGNFLDNFIYLYVEKTFWLINFYVKYGSWNYECNLPCLQNCFYFATWKFKCAEVGKFLLFWIAIETCRANTVKHLVK